MIVADDVSLTLDGRSILENVGLSVASGESVALVGPNGSGKTSVLRCLLGLVPFNGRVTIGGQDMSVDPVACRRLTAHVAQRAAFGDATAAEVLVFVAKIRRIDRGNVHDVLETIGLRADAQRRVRTFSGGMLQRLALGAALLADTPVMLFDEPSASLDLEGQQTFVEIVGRLRREGRTLILASHRPEEVHSLTDRVIHLDRGHTVTPAAAAHERGERSARVVPFTPVAERR